MAGLGETMSNHETGTVDRPSPVVDKQIPDAKQDIKATTSVETVNQLLFQNWVYKTTYAIDPAMQAGHVFGYFRNHPYECHRYVAHFAQAFKMWTGGMKVRARFAANFANGGSFRIGFLPPTYSQEEVSRGLPLSALTAYPNIDLDPKNTDWTQFQIVDERRMSFHVMDGELNMDNFGGWIIFYVVMPLVTTLQAQGSVSLAVEVAGDYQFRQPSPLESVSPVTQGGPLINSLNFINLQSGCDDGSYVPFGNSIQILKSEIKNLTTGCFNAEGFGGFGPTNVLKGGLWTEQAQAYRDILQNRTALIVNSGFGQTLEVAQTEDIGRHILSNNSSYQWQLNKEPHSYTVVGSGEQTEDLFFFPGQGYCWHTDKKEFYIQVGQAPRPISKTTDTSIFPVLNNTDENKNPITVNMPTDQDLKPVCNFLPMVSGESIVCFANHISRTINSQTSQMRSEIKEFRGDSTSSYLYSLKSSDGRKLLSLRLCPNGMFTTTSSSKDVLIPFDENTNYYLEYIGKHPIHSPLPFTAENRLSIMNFRQLNSEYRKGLNYASFVRH